MRFTDEQKKTIKVRIANHRYYDRKRFGTSIGTITYEEWLELYIEQSGTCYWTGKPMTLAEDKPTDASLDRIDCNKPHTIDNTVLVHRSLNLGRNDASLHDWVTYLDSMGLLSDEHKQDLCAT